MAQESKYLYCIISAPTGVASHRTKGAKINEVSPCYGVGINNQETNLIYCKDIAAVVSDTPIINFDNLDKEELTKHIAIHQKVNEEAMKDYDVIPMTFGIIAPSIDEALRILEKVYLQFKTALKKIEGKVEFVVQVWWDQKKLLEELSNTNQEIQKLKQQASLKTSILGMPIKLKLGKLICRELETQRKTFINDIRAFLKSSSHDSTLNKLTDEEMIANFSFLIEKARESELDKKMQELGKKYDGKLRFKYIGPMPPYSFVNINLGLGNFELVNEARKLLGISEEVTFDEIKKAYYELSHQYHPDKHQGDLEKEEQMKKIVHAYDILENYCQSWDEFAGKKGDQKYSFKEEDVKNSIMIH